METTVIFKPFNTDLVTEFVSLGKAAQWLAWCCTLRNGMGPTCVPIPQGTLGKENLLGWLDLLCWVGGAAWFLPQIPAMSQTLFPMSSKCDPRRQCIASERMDARLPSAKSCELPQLLGHPHQQSGSAAKVGWLWQDVRYPPQLLLLSKTRRKCSEKSYDKTGRPLTTYHHRQSRLSFRNINPIYCQLITELDSENQKQN